MKVLDLFSGLGGWSQAFVDRGHTVYRIEKDEKFDKVPCTIIGDVMNFEFGSPAHAYDVVLASPPCQAFSLAAGGKHMMAYARCNCGRICQREKKEVWSCVCQHPKPVDKTFLRPRSAFGRESVQLVHKTLRHIADIEPKFWWLENPNGGMIHFVPESVPRTQVTYCQYGDSRMKLTNLWGQWPNTWTPRPRCANRAPCPNCGAGQWICERCLGHPGLCHEPAPRGAKTGTQGVKGAANRALVPYELSLEVCLAVEAAL